MRQMIVRTLPTLLCAALMTGCGATSSREVIPSTSAPVTEGPRIVDEANASFTLSITNQSFTDRTVELAVSIDGTRLITREFPVRNQHYQESFPIRLTLGRHLLTVTSSTGVSIERSFDLTADSRYAFVSYMNDDNYDAQNIAHRIKQIACVFSSHRILMS